MAKNKKHNNNTSKEKDVLETLGCVTLASSNVFKVKLVEFQDREINATLSGKMKFNSIKVIVGDFVNVELSTYNLNSGRIVYRYQSDPRKSNINSEKHEENIKELM